jgi:hypothetical protein
LNRKRLKATSGAEITAQIVADPDTAPDVADKVLAPDRACCAPPPA